MARAVVTTLAAALLTVPAMAQAPQDRIAQANAGTVGVITGMEGGTYAKTAADLTILDSDTLRVLPMLGKGSLQNLSDILYLKGIDIGFVQADALTYAKQHNLFPIWRREFSTSRSCTTKRCMSSGARTSLSSRIWMASGSTWTFPEAVQR